MTVYAKSTPTESSGSESSPSRSSPWSSPSESPKRFHRPKAKRGPGSKYAVTALRIAFGGVWAFDAVLKWFPGFANHFLSTLTAAKTGQPAMIKGWIGLWVDIVRANPHLFARLDAIGESFVALALILGAFTNFTYVFGSLLTLTIWSTAEGFGGPYVAGTSTDVGPALIYVFVFAALYLVPIREYGLDQWLAPRIGRFAILCNRKREPSEIPELAEA